MPDVSVTLSPAIWKAVADVLSHDLDSDHYEEFPQFLADLETAHEAISAAAEE